MVFSDIGVFHYLILGSFLFIIGFLGMIICKNLIKMLISSEILITSVCINFIAIAYFCDGIKLEGTSFSIFVSFIMLAQSLILAAIIFNLYKYKKITSTDKLKELKG